jgi:subtilisin family serine protease
METKEYIVSLKEGVDYTQFWHDIESGTSGSQFLPHRQVSIVDPRLVMERICNYALTDTEAELLKQDPRVAGVDLPLDQQSDIIVGFSAIQNGNFTKPRTYLNRVTPTVDSTDNLVNWGLIRHINVTNVYGTNKTTNQTYNYNLDGSGIDIVIADTGIEPTHPEFTFAGNTTSRVVQYNWNGNLNCSIGSTDFLDTFGHGTHVAGIVAGKTYGWAKNAMIYPMKLQLANVTGAKIALDKTAFDLVKAWHIRKNTPGDSIYTGRPTVVNLSLGAFTYYSTKTVTAINYRNSGNVPATKPDSNKGMISILKGDIEDQVIGYAGGTNVAFPVRLSSIDTGLEELIDAGITVCTAAGNSGHKIDVPGGIDYNNYFIASDNTINYYHRGSSPYSNTAIKVGSITGYGYNTTQDQKANFSNGGPGVDLYAAGFAVRSATSNVVNTTSFTSTASYYWNNNYQQLSTNGTSMAAPQVAGMAALYLQAHPTATPAQVKQWLISQTDPNSMYTTNKNDDYTVTNSQWGGSAGVALAPLGVINVKNSSNQWANVANVYVKSTSNTWAPVKTVWVKIDDSTWRPAC